MNHADLIVARIERARQERGISVAELARRVGVVRIIQGALLASWCASSSGSRKAVPMKLSPILNYNPFAWDHFGTTWRPKHHETRKRSEANSLPTCDFMVAGAGFEPTTFGL